MKIREFKQELRSSTGGGLFVLLNKRWFWKNFWANRLYKSKQLVLDFWCVAQKLPCLNSLFSGHSRGVVVYEKQPTRVPSEERSWQILASHAVVRKENFLHTISKLWYVWFQLVRNGSSYALYSTFSKQRDQSIPQVENYKNVNAKKSLRSLPRGDNTWRFHCTIEPPLSGLPLLGGH